MNTCRKCGEPSEYEDLSLCYHCYTVRHNHPLSIINPQARHRPARLLAVAIAALLLAMLCAALIYDQAHAADLQIQLLVGGKPAVGVDYTLDGDPVNVPARALLHGTTDADGRISATGIATGTWMLYAACLAMPVHVGEVQGQALMQADGSCVVWLPVVKN